MIFRKITEKGKCIIVNEVLLGIYNRRLKRYAEMKLTTAIKNLNTAGFELIEINVDSTEIIYATYYVWEDDKFFVKNLS